jgi:alkyldihydroxyacetonephosphate synthase
VIYVSCHDQVEKLVPLAVKHNIVIIPYGGGTNVTQALLCETNEKRMIVSLDMTRMNHVRWVDRRNLMACVEAGILGQDLERELNRYGLVCGHEPDSVEFSSLGGWISTRASGMKKNRYGNIDDILINVKLVTPNGVFTKKQDCPRVSSGPDLNEFVLGSEGTLGVITEAVIKVRPMPKKKVFDSIIFYDFEIGVQFMNEVGNSKVLPASIRLIDNIQFQFGLALKPEVESKYDEFLDKAKKYFVTKVKKFEPAKMAVVTLLFEGTDEEVKYQENSIYAIAKRYKGMRAG